MSLRGVDDEVIFSFGEIASFPLRLHFDKLSVTSQYPFAKTFSLSLFTFIYTLI
jgi:hypothetical protein